MITFIRTLKKFPLHHRWFGIIFVIMAAIASAAGAVQVFLQGGMSEAALDGDTNALVMLLVWLSVISFISLVSSSVRVLLRGRFQAKVGYVLRESFITHYLKIPFKAFEKFGSGESLSVFSNDVPAATDLIGFSGWFMLELFLTYVASFILMFILSPMLTLILIALIPVLLGVQILTSMPIQNRQKQMSLAQADFNAVVNDSLQNISTVAAYSLEEVLEDHYMESYEKFLKAFYKFMHTLIPLITIGFIIMGIPIAVINATAAFRVLDGYMTIAEVVAFSAVATVSLLQMGSFAEMISGLQGQAGRAKRMHEAMEDKLEVMNKGMVYKEDKIGITFNNVSFSYNGEENVLHGVSFEIKPNTKTGFVGGSGSGKSTALKLITGLYAPTDGQIILNDLDAVHIAKSDLRELFAYVPQDSFLFPESIKENITLSDFDEERLVKACTDAGILTFINSLPEKFDSVLAESAENVSGGQRQRISLARAFYKNAPVLLFDEATSALDVNTEAEILESLANAAEGKTVVMVAHRASAVASCDNIIVFDKGNIVGCGTHEELLKTNEVYKNLYESNSGNGVA